MNARLALATLVIVASAAHAAPKRKPAGMPKQVPDVAAPRLGPDGEVDPRFLQMHASFLEQGKKEKIGVLFIGDSITEGWRTVPDLWHERYGSYSPANFGIAGDQTQHVLWRIEHGELDVVRPKLVVLLIGTNNIDRKPEDIFAGVSKVVGAIRGKLPQTKILLLGIFPRGADPKDKQTAVFRQRIYAVNDRLAYLGDGQKVRFLDIGDEFVDEEGRIKIDLLPDALHPNAAGYEVWANAIQDHFNQMIQ
ncbi:MAG: hypothetical protein JST16_08225 [Bdellovibrionales bacterium]|nr:hypothetical protein [Bdellovibrionales bacterium]